MEETLNASEESTVGDTVEGPTESSEGSEVSPSVVFYSHSK